MLVHLKNAQKIFWVTALALVSLLAKPDLIRSAFKNLKRGPLVGMTTFGAVIITGSLIRGTAPKSNYGGRVMCFLETGNRKATVLRFDYEHPPVPPKPAWHWHAAKWIFNRIYWNTVPQGRIPERVATSERSES